MRRHTNSRSNVDITTFDAPDLDIWRVQVLIGGPYPCDDHALISTILTFNAVSTFQVLIGGPYPCDDHAQRGVELSLAILKLLASISQRLQAPVTGRIGMHTGKVAPPRRFQKNLEHILYHDRSILIITELQDKLTDLCRN
jgi:hypothetical protein